MGKRGRIGLQPLGVDKAEHAFPKELMVDYTTGGVYISDTNNITVSIDEIDRTKNHLNRFKDISIQNNIYSDIYEIITDKYSKPRVISYGENILDTVLQLPLYTQCLLGIDVEALINNQGHTELCDISFLKSEIIFKLTLSDKSTLNVNINKKISEVNKYPIYFQANKDITKVELSSIKILQDASTVEIYRTILFNVLITGK
ncbi:MAG TPA: hypothetical protein DCE23_03160 [Firmicutes bacterium]|nr:hypothetical protein [Bacillota bacterium]